MQQNETELKNTEAYIVTARKWRPLVFADVVGQEHVSTTLRNAVQSGRLHHAYIFNGPRGVGKTTTARILAKAVNCRARSTEGEPCNECSSCREILAGRSIDVIEIDGASNNSVEDVRKLRENAKYPPVAGSHKMYIIDEVHMLSTSAFNALLKTLEEPPPHLLFVFATTEPHKVPATILSRCQRFDFRRMQIEEIVNHLRHIAQAEGVTIDEESLHIIARKGDGSMRDSQSVFDQVLSFCGSTVEYTAVNEALNLIDQEFFFTLAYAIRTRDINNILEITRQVFLRGYDLQECLHGLAEHYRNLITILVTGNTKLIETSKEFLAKFREQAAHYSQADVLNLMQVIMQTEQALRFAPQPRLRFEFALIQMANLPSALEMAGLLKDLAEIKERLAAGHPVTINVPAVSQAPAVSAPAASDTPPLVQAPKVEYATSAPPANSSTAAPERSDIPQGENPARSESPHASINTGAQAQSDARPPATGAPQTPIVISAAELEQRWQNYLDERRNARFKKLKMIMSDRSSFDVAFRDNTVVITANTDFVGSSLNDDKALFAESLEAFFGAPIQVSLHGAGLESQTFDMFGSTLKNAAASTAAQTASTPASGGNRSTVGHKRESGGDTRDSQNAQAQSVLPNGSGRNERHPLDNSIVNLFNAVELPRR